MSTSAADSWSAHATGYASKVTHVTQAGGAALLQLLGLIDDDAVVLDSGAGSGALTALIREQSAHASITAGDIAPGMLGVLQKRAIPHVQTTILDASADHIAQGLQERQFTHVFSTFMMQFVPDPQFTVAEMIRVVRPGGKIALSIWSDVQTGEPWNIACSNLDPEYESNHGVFGKAWKTVDDMALALDRAGFVDTRTSESEHWLIFESAEDFAETFITSGNPAFLKLQSTWKGKLEDVREELIKVTREQFDNGRLRMVAAHAVARRPE